jgi:hypothetical protein
MASQWYDNLPSPRSSPRSMTDTEIAALITNSTKSVGKDYIIVDVRRTDFGVSVLQTAEFDIVDAYGSDSSQYPRSEFLLY